MTALLLWLVAAALPASAAVADGRGPWVSESGAYTLSFASRLEPMVINRMHAWVLHLETAAGEPVDGATFEVTGGMPAHDHGLPTNPRVTEALGGGDYLLEGVRFHMPGAWELTFRIEVGGARDVVLVPLSL